MLLRARQIREGYQHPSEADGAVDQMHRPWGFQNISPSSLMLRKPERSAEYRDFDDCQKLASIGGCHFTSQVESTGPRISCKWQWFVAGSPLFHSERFQQSRADKRLGTGLDALRFSMTLLMASRTISKAARFCLRFMEGVATDITISAVNAQTRDGDPLERDSAHTLIALSQRRPLRALLIVMSQEIVFKNPWNWRISPTQSPPNKAASKACWACRRFSA